MWQEAIVADGDATLLLLDVTSGAKNPEFPSGFNKWRGRISIKVHAQPQVGRANRAVIDAVSAIGQCEIVAGQTDSRKSVRIQKPREEVIAWLKTRL